MSGKTPVKELVNINRISPLRIFWIEDRKFPNFVWRSVRRSASLRAIPTIAGLRELADETGDGSLPRLVLTWPEEGR